jgi:hypothetical protein
MTDQDLVSRLNAVYSRPEDNARDVVRLSLRPGIEHQRQLFINGVIPEAWDNMEPAARWQTLVEHGKINILYVDVDYTDNYGFTLFAAATGIPVKHTADQSRKPKAGDPWQKIFEKGVLLRVIYADYEPGTETAKNREEMLILGNQFLRLEVTTSIRFLGRKPSVS